MISRIFFSVLFLLCCATLTAQNLTQIIRGRVVDKITQSPLPGANIVVLNTTVFLGAATDENGSFKINNVPVGNRSLKISFIGYKELVLPVVVVNSGKEVVLNIELDEN